MNQSSTPQDQTRLILQKAAKEWIEKSGIKTLEEAFVAGAAFMASHETRIVPKEDLLKKRALEFGNSLVPFVGTYGKETIREFYDYWTEPNKSRTKMKFELEVTWDVERRLRRWASSNFRAQKTLSLDEPIKKKYKTA